MDLLLGVQSGVTNLRLGSVRWLGKQGRSPVSRAGLGDALGHSPKLGHQVWAQTQQAQSLGRDVVTIPSKGPEGRSPVTSGISQFVSPSLGQTQQAQRTDMWRPSIALGRHEVTIPSLRAPRRG